MKAVLVLCVTGCLAGCVAAPPVPIPPPPIATGPAPGAQDPSLARDAALDGFASSAPDAGRVFLRDVPTPAGPVKVAGLTMPDTVFFDFGIASPRPDSASALDALARAVQTSPPDSVLTVAGNTDAIGTDASNRALSFARARAVVAALAARGIDPRRLAAIGFGASRPIAPNASDEGRALNRRVELALSPSFAANAASFTETVPVEAVSPAPVEREHSIARHLAPLNVRPNQLSPVAPNSLGPAISY